VRPISFVTRSSILLFVSLCCRLVISKDVLILEVARLRLQEAVAVHERSNPSNPELPVLRQSLKELIDRLNTLPAQLSSGL
jgi:hypothetical protein